MEESSEGTIKEKIYLWLDDVRPAPEGWVWVKTVLEAKEALQKYEVVAASLDHDLGAVAAPGFDPDDPDPEEVWYLQGDSKEGSGYDLVKWMCEDGVCTSSIKVIRVHSWNPAGAKQMVDTLKRRFPDIKCVYDPFNVKKRF